MKHNYYSLTFQRNLTKFHKFYHRLNKKIRNGSFKQLSAKKRAFLVSRLEELTKKLDHVNPGFAAMVTTASLTLALTTGTANAQTFVRDTTDNPVKSFLYTYPEKGYSNPVEFNQAKPSFVDLDGDGDQDCIVGSWNGVGNDYYGYIEHAFTYLQNTGTVSAPVFTEQTSSTTNPFYSINPYGAAAAFADMDGDGDFDMIDVSGYNFYNYTFSLGYYKNTGTKTAPAFTFQYSSSGVFGANPTARGMAPALVDIDGDGDQDLFVGDYTGNVTYYKNTGSPTSPSFTSATSPLGSINISKGSSFTAGAAPAFADVDNDGDYDALIGAYYVNNMVYLKNTGTKTNPVFTTETGANDPFTVISTSLRYNAPAFVDIDGDGDQDLFIGDEDGANSVYASYRTFSIEYYKNEPAGATGITSAATISDVSVFPNPTNNMLNVSMGSQSGDFTATILNATGISIQQTTVSVAAGTSSSINVSNLTQGLYTIKLEQDGKLAAVKFIKD